MREERTITINGQVHTVVIADEKKALLDAEAAGRAMIGLWDRSAREPDLAPAKYLVECLEEVDDACLEQVVRRKLGLPWKIGETKRLMIREFTMEDISQMVQEEGDTLADAMFYTPEKLKDYIQFQYDFFQYGIWALVRKSDGQLVGKAGVTNIAPDDCEPGVELGYHIFSPYRHQGYAMEACREILFFTVIHLECPVYVRIDASNEASIRVAVKCGFQFTKKICNESGQCSYLYSWCC